MTTPEFRTHVDRLLLEGNLGLALAPQLDDAAPGVAPGLAAHAGQPASPGDMDGIDGSFQVALRPRSKAFMQSMMHASGADQGFDRTLGRMTAGAFGPAEIKTLEDRALTAVEWPDVGILKGIGEGPPVTLNAKQKATVDRLMGQIGSDDLAARAKSAYGKALNGGQIRVR